MRRREPQVSFPTRVLNKLSSCCDFKCSVCYFVFSLWGCVMLLVLGALLAQNYVPVHMNDLTAEESRAAAPAAFAAAGVYGGFVVLCAIRFSWILIASRRNQYERV